MEERFKNNGEKSWEKSDKTTTTNGQDDSLEDDEQGQIDDVIGNFGKYQFLIFMFKILIGVTSAFNNLGVTFFAPTDFVSFWCADLPADSTTSLSSISSFSSSSSSSSYLPSTNSSYIHENPLKFIVQDPVETHLHHYHSSYGHSNATKQSNTHYQQVFGEFMFNSERKYRHDASSDTPKNLRKECKYLSPADNKYHKCTSYRYDTGIWISTIIDEWDLVCDRAWLISMTQSLYMSGFILSFLMFGYISDRFGRWNSLLLGALIEILSGFGCALASSVTWFMIFRFLVGLGNAGRSSSSYLIMIEWIGPKWRMHISTLGSLGWVVGYCSMPWITLHFLHFRHMQLFACFYELIFVIWLLRLPESPRWLLTHKRFNEAYEVLLMAAKFNGLIKKADTDSIINGTDSSVYALDHQNSIKVNGKSLANGQQMHKDVDVESSAIGANITDDELRSGESLKKANKVLRPYTIEQFNVKFKRLVNTIYAKEFTSNEDKLSIIDLFKWKNLRRYSLILFFVWAANSFVYYGIALRVGDFGGKNLFIAFTIAGITELPSLAFTILCMKFLPRRTANLFILTTTGLLCALQAPLKYYNYQRLQQASIMLAKLFNSCSFTCILYQTMELFPTSIRQTAYSSCSLAGRIGSILAPFIKELAQMTNEFVPSAIYATLSCTAAVLLTALPETKGSDLTDTLLEAERFKGVEHATGGSSPRQIDPTVTGDGHSLTRRKSSSHS